MLPSEPAGNRDSSCRFASRPKRVIPYLDGQGAAWEDEFVSAETLDVVSRLNAAFNAGDWALSELLDPAVEFVGHLRFPTSRPALTDQISCIRCSSIDERVSPDSTQRCSSTST
jgi:hypothetical protein